MITTVSAADVAAALHQRIPGLTSGRLHKLLYLGQGHHLAWFDEPLFEDVISAWDAGPTVAALRTNERHDPVAGSGAGQLGERELNTVGYVVSRYGALSVRDLETLTKGGSPWARADSGRRAGESVPIQREWMAEHFRGVDVDEEEPPLDAAQLAALLKASAG